MTTATKYIDRNGISHFIGASTDSKPTVTTLPPGSTYWEYDTQIAYIATASGWQEKSAPVRVTGDYRGAYPETELDDTQAFSGTAAAFGTTTDISALGLPFRKLVFTKSASVQTGTVRCGFNGAGAGMIVVAVAGGETLAVTALIDGTNASDAICVRKTDGTFVAASALASGTYYLVTR